MKEIKSTIISAYACDPFKGSEPGIGWNWVIELAKLNYKVYVITRKINEAKINRGLENFEYIDNIQFYFYDLPKKYSFIEKIPFGVYLHYFVWQRSIVSRVRTLVNENNIDLVHHLTWGVFRQPSFLYKIDKPFVFGPIGGAEMTPNKLLVSLPSKDYIKEYLRVLSNYVLRLSPILNKMYKNTDVILCRTDETSNFLPFKFKEKTHVKVDIGIRNVDAQVKRKRNKKFKVLYVGRFMGWKGVHLSIDAINKLNEKTDSIEFTIIGSGPFEKELKKRVRSASINFINWVPQKDLPNYYKTHDCFLFPSFHDSGGTVILEAFSFGLPVICLDIGGPNKYVDSSSGIKVSVQNKDYNTVVEEISKSLTELKNNNEKLLTLSNGALEKAKFYNWESIVKSSYDLIKNNLS